jgi:multidrug efflux pump subunit AcrB
VSSPQLSVDVDEPKALSLGIPLDALYATLQATMGTLYVNDFNRSGKTYKVQLSADAAYRMKPEDLGKSYVRTVGGTMIPLSAVISVKTIVGPEMVERFNGFIAAKVLGNAAPGRSSGEAIGIVESVAREVLPPGYSLEWTGQAFQEKRTGITSVLAMGFGIIMVFLILAAQYERWSLPLAVILAVPFAILGALLAVWMRGMPNDIYFQIGLVVLVGLAAKNAILIVEFAAQKQEEGMSAVEASLEAARLRFRPICMTALAFVLGVVPLVIATGAPVQRHAVRWVPACSAACSRRPLSRRSSSRCSTAGSAVARPRRESPLHLRPIRRRPRHDEDCRASPGSSLDRERAAVRLHGRT